MTRLATSWLPLIVASGLSACGTTRQDPPSSGPIGASDRAPAGTTGIKGDVLTGGRVRFSGFPDSALADFRIVPEHDGELWQPARNGLIREVDGFWWRHDRDRWFKIPNHCHCEVVHDPSGPHPSSFKTRSHCADFGSWLQSAKGRVAEPGFHPDTGATGHPSDWPWGGHGLPR